MVNGGSSGKFGVVADRDFLIVEQSSWKQSRHIQQTKERSVKMIKNSRRVSHEEGGVAFHAKLEPFASLVSVSAS